MAAQNTSHQLTTRQSAILTALIERYVREGKPVSSKELCTASGFDLSPATIRNELKILDEIGYISSPHTSAGRVPTDIGYRFYVASLLRQPVASDISFRPSEVEVFKQRLSHLEDQLDAQTKIMARLVAELTKDMAFMIDGPDHVEPAGFAQLLEKQEFQDPAHARAIAAIVDEPEKFWRSIVDHSMKHSKKENVLKSSKGKTRVAMAEASRELTAPEGDVQVFIGPEAGLTSMDASLVVASYETPAGEKGAIAVLGSTRMNYARNVSVVRMLSKLLSSGTFGAVAILLIMPQVWS